MMGYADRQSAEQRRSMAGQIAQKLQNCHSAYALVDTAFYYETDKNFVAKAEAQLGAARHLMSHIIGAQPNFSPLLFTLPVADQRQSVIESALGLCNGEPMLSFIGSALPSETLHAHLALHTEAMLLPDRTTYVLRFADTRITPVLMSILSKAQQATLLGPLQHWICLGRDARPLHWQGANQDVIAEEMPQLSPEQVDAMLEHGQPDEILHRLAEELDINSLSNSPSARHQKISQWLEQARAEGIEDEIEQLAYCYTQAQQSLQDAKASLP